MYNSKLIQVYSHLNKEEKTLFKKWVRSPAHNQHEELILLFDFITSKRKLTERVVAKEKVFKFIYPNKTYNDLRLRHLMTLGVQLLEDFVCFFMQKEEQPSQEKYLIRFYRERNLDKYLAQEFKKANQIPIQTSLKDQTYYYHQYQMEVRRFDDIIHRDRVASNNVDGILESYVIHTIIGILKNACIALPSQNIDQKNQYEIIFLEAVLKEVDTGKYEDIIAIQFYFNAYKCAKYDKDVKYFFKLKELLVQHQDCLEREQIIDLYDIAVNYCIKEINKDYTNFFINEVFNLYLLGLDYEFVMEYGFIDRFAYKNIITIALILKKEEWVAQFIEEYTSRLEEQYQTNYYHFAKISLFEKQENYEQALVLLNQAQFDDLFLNLIMKQTEIKIYYEMENFQLVEAFLTNLYTYLQRKGRTINQYESYKIFIKNMRKLLAINKYDKEAIRGLKKEIQDRAPHRKHSWFFKQLDKLLE